jgi:hypothetical protein
MPNEGAPAMLDLLQWAIRSLAALGVICLVYLTTLRGKGGGEGGDEFIHLG